MTFNSLILIWFDKSKRNLPWRAQSDPYKIWLSEIILQQTRVAQGTAYYELFCEKFPTIFDLANASEQEVLKTWQGLGYYSRARNLHHTAKFIVNERQGEFPDNYNELLQLKGVGEYTAAAIASIAFQQAQAAVDGNVFRVFSRYFNIELDISLGKTKKYFIDLGNQIIDPKRPGDFNQAVMELGATVCLPRNPMCDICPLNASCAALVKNNVHERPVKTKKVKVKHRYLNFLDISDGEHYLMAKRGSADVWQGLFTFPLVELTMSQNLDEQDFFSELNLTLEHEEIHLLTHQKLHINFWKSTLDFSTLENLAKEFEATLYSIGEISELPLPKPMEKYFNKII
ncbi:MAG TPA: A/G-specific adenine glycosylase [Moheibacter sp.]|nr:A/G-specific adenine glycosylase [Moheibacter sp.]